MLKYDKYYKIEDLFGAPYPELIDFFKGYEPKGKLLDLGCGQGRDALALARLGFQVTGIDNSKIGIEQMMKISARESLGITGIVEDIYRFKDFVEFDIVLLDSMFHFNRKDKKKETELIKKVARSIMPGALICICIQDTGSKVRVMKDAVLDSGIRFKALSESCLMYTYEDKESGHSSKTRYCLYINRKVQA